MANMHLIKNRIRSIKETRQITKAMNLISAVKLKKARSQLEATLPYFVKVKQTLADILCHSCNIDNNYCSLNNDFAMNKNIDSKINGYLILSGDKSLAGSYNHNIIKLVENTIEDKANSILYVAGNMGRNHFIRNKYNVVTAFDFIVQNPTVFRAREITEIILNDFSSGDFGSIYMIYTEMITSLHMETKKIKLLPLDMNLLATELPDDKIKLDESIIYEPNPKAVYDVLIPKYLKGIVYGALVEAFTSEQNSRMAAMDNATSNADDMIHDLNLFYNRARQSTITQEISEIVSGATALNK